MVGATTSNGRKHMSHFLSPTPGFCRSPEWVGDCSLGSQTWDAFVVLRAVSWMHDAAVHECLGTGEWGLIGAHITGLCHRTPCKNAVATFLTFCPIQKFSANSLGFGCLEPKLNIWGFLQICTISRKSVLTHSVHYSCRIKIKKLNLRGSTKSPPPPNQECAMNDFLSSAWIAFPQRLLYA